MAESSLRARVRDLFPETLLVSVHDGHTFTTSLKVAEHFHKLHKTVLRAYENRACSEEFSRRNFVPRDYVDERGKTQPLIEMTQGGFAFLAMGFTGALAARFKEDFINAFEAMEAAVHAQEARRAQALAQLRPHWVTIEEADRQGLTRTQIILRTGHKSAASITANRARMRAMGLPCAPVRKGVQHG